MKTRQFALLAVLVFAMPLLAQTAEVTFYSPTPRVKYLAEVSLSPVGTEPYIGWFYQDGKKLAKIVPNRFVTFQVSAGVHKFAGSSDPKGWTPPRILQLNVEEGQRYCVRLTAKFESAVVLPLGASQGRFELIPCAQAGKESHKAKPLEKKKVDKAEQADWDDSTKFPGQ